MTTPAIASRNHPRQRDCPPTVPRSRQVADDLPWLAQPSGWTPLANCGVQVAVRYHSADSELRTGGDWYLAMPLAGGDLLLAVGDVAGHGLTAAPEMARLRYAMAAFATTCDDPSAIVGRLNAAACRRGEVTATVVAARFTPGSGELTWAQAGHLPILAASRCGIRRLPSPDGMMLGVDPAARYGRATTRLDPGDYLVMFTDGILRRSDSIDQGIDAVARLAADARCCPPSLLDHVNYQAAGDDACVLVAERVR